MSIYSYLSFWEEGVGPPSSAQRLFLALCLGVTCNALTGPNVVLTFKATLSYPYYLCSSIYKHICINICSCTSNILTYIIYI